MNALRYMAFVTLLIAVFGPGMAVLFDPVVAAGIALLLLGLAAGASSEDESEGPSAEA